MNRLGHPFSLLGIVVGILLLCAPPLRAQQPEQGEFYFIHVPSHVKGVNFDKVKDGLRQILELLKGDWQWRHPEAGDDRPRIWLLGFAGPWEEHGAAKPNFAGQAAEELGEESDLDCLVGETMPISYCQATRKVRRRLGQADIVVAMGEDANRDSFQLEVHGAERAPNRPDCGGELPAGPVCAGEECRGTDWDEAACTGCAGLTRGERIQCCYDPGAGGIPIEVDPEDAGSFICGFTCCQSGRP